MDAETEGLCPESECNLVTFATEKCFYFQMLRGHLSKLVLPFGSETDAKNQANIGACPLPSVGGLNEQVSRYSDLTTFRNYRNCEKAHWLCDSFSV
jgi:hypothetical protein